MNAKKNENIGRPTKLTPEIHAEIVDYIKVGNYVETTVALVGISRSTYYAWIKKANESVRRNKYTHFRDDVIQAKAWSEARDVAIIARHSETKWQASAWRLERKFPEKWGRNNKTVETCLIEDSDVSDEKERDREEVKKAIKEVMKKRASKLQEPNPEPGKEESESDNENPKEDEEESESDKKEPEAEEKILEDLKKLLSFFVPYNHSSLVDLFCLRIWLTMQDRYRSNAC